MLKVHPPPEYPPEEGRYLRGNDYSPAAVVIILSHGHLDHTGGLPGLARHLAGAVPGESPARAPCIVAHPRCFWQKEKEGRKNGSPVSEAEARQQYPVACTSLPSKLTLAGYCPVQEAGVSMKFEW